MEKKVTHEIKLQKSVIFFLAILAIGVFANAFGPVLTIKEAMAELDGGSVTYPLHIRLDCSGCR